MTLAPAVMSQDPDEMIARSLTCPAATSTENKTGKVVATRSGVEVSVETAVVEFQTAMTVPALLAPVEEL
jgi:hypothetical protein